MKKRRKKKRSILREVLGLLAVLVVLCLLIYLAIRFVGEQVEISDDSMYPTLSDEDRVIVEKLSYEFSDPKRFDVVVFPLEYQEDAYSVKRVIGLPGETVQIRDGVIYINGNQLDDSYGYETIKNPGLASEGVTLGEQEYFVLGDNRNDSIDSREPSVGNVSRSEMIGRAVFCMWPMKAFGFIR